MQRRSFELGAEAMDGLGRGDVVKAQTFVKRIDLGGGDVAAASDYICVPLFDLGGKIQKLSHRSLHIRH